MFLFQMMNHIRNFKNATWLFVQTLLAYSMILQQPNLNVCRCEVVTVWLTNGDEENGSLVGLDICGRPWLALNWFNSIALSPDRRS